MKTFPIENISIKQLKITENNPNSMGADEFAQLVVNIREHGFFQPILVRKDGDDLVLVDGEHRVRAAKQLKAKLIPAVVCDSNADVALAMRIGMNRLRGHLDLAKVSRDALALVEAGWDIPALTATGFTAAELEDLVEVDTPDFSELTDDFDPKPIEESPDDFGDDKVWELTLTFESKKHRDKVKRYLLNQGNNDAGQGALNLATGGEP